MVIEQYMPALECADRLESVHIFHQTLLKMRKSYGKYERSLGMRRWPRAKMLYIYIANHDWKVHRPD